MIAHDLIEHANGPHAVGSVEDELEAIGAMWFTRGFSGAFFEIDFPQLVEYIPRGHTAAQGEAG